MDEADLPGGGAKGVIEGDAARIVTKQAQLGDEGNDEGEDAKGEGEAGMEGEEVLVGPAEAELKAEGCGGGVAESVGTDLFLAVKLVAIHGGIREEAVGVGGAGKVGPEGGGGCGSGRVGCGTVGGNFGGEVGGGPSGAEQDWRGGAGCDEFLGVIAHNGVGKSDIVDAN